MWEISKESGSFFSGRGCMPKKVRIKEEKAFRKEGISKESKFRSCVKVR